jgi:carbon monoxide dehydrogenase subunit G
MIIKSVLIVCAGLAVLIAALLAYAATKPDTVLIQREARIRASPEKIFAFVNDFHRWGLWAPQDTMDPTMKRTYRGAASGKGAISEWRGNSSSGQGRMEITDSSVPNKVTIQVDFEKPFRSHNINEITLEPADDSTLVTWKWDGTNVYMLKVTSVFVDMDTMMGKHFEAGLANLKTLAEQ